MKKNILNTLLFLIILPFMGLVVRHDVPDKKFIELAKNYPQICHFPMGEGTLVGESWILTAGHVGSDLKRDKENGMNPTVVCNGNKYEIDKVIVNPEFKSIEMGLDNDISLVKIKGSVIGITPAKIYSGKDEVGKNIVLVGMGDVGTGLTGPQKWDKITRAATNKIDAVEDNWVSFKFDAPDSPNTTEHEGVSGPGDSGGPALTKLGKEIYILGVSSFQRGQDKFGKGHYGVTEYYSRVSKYSKWITGVMQNKIKDEPASRINQKYDSNSVFLELVGTYGMRKIVMKNEKLFFQMEEEPLIPMKKIGNDLYLWDDNNTKLQFHRNAKEKITGFDIIRRSGEVVKVDRTN